MIPSRRGFCSARRGVSVLLAMLPLAASAQTPPVAALTPGDYADEAKLAALLWDRSPDVLDARTSAGIAASEVTRARAYPNPALDFTWGTIPVGRTNPPDLSDRLNNVPNYNAGLSELVELAKRGPRQAATVAEFERSRLQAVSTLAAAPSGARCSAPSPSSSSAARSARARSRWWCCR